MKCIFLILNAALLCPFSVYASSTAAGDIKALTSTVDKITGLLTGPFAQGAFLLAIVLAGGAWWMNRSSKAGETLGRIILGAIIIFGATQVVGFLNLSSACI